ncbi:hypothetical protein LG634_18210 [Streptomyces bambusae]|uniref:hypothetical protein n=1 Tax=Streptomyces bambusae TaxID=1550616 RepID=UPI001CFD3E03|nr:hypothetical protein [Streptomyces bambusae]MCB5166767.1 hypothetical protein [Streptomyces bambusae]
MGTTPHALARYAGCALLAALAAAGCSTPGPPAPPGPATPSTTPSPAPRTSSPADVCTSLITYWAREALTGGKWAGLDWEQKGMSNGQFEIHEQVLAEARAEQRTRGREAALELIERRTRQRCTEERGALRSSENWRPPR